MNTTVRHGPLAWFLDCAPILRAANLHRNRRRGRFGKLLTALALAGAVAGVSASVHLLARTELGLHKALALVVGGVLAAFAIGNLLNLLSAGALQNTPANAVLAPRLNRLVRRSVVLLWLAAMAAIALLSTAVPHGVLVPLAAHLFLLTLMSLRGYAALAWVLLYPLQALGDRYPVSAFLETPAVLALCYTGALLLGWRVLNKAFPTGGDGHFALIKKTRMVDLSVRPMSDWTQHERTRKESRPFYARLLARDIEARRPARLLMHVFGPGCQRFYVVASWLMYAVLAVLTWLAVRFWWPQYHQGVAFMVMMAAVPALVAQPVMSAHRFAAGLAATAREQALFTLAPAAPRPAAMNRMLARTILRTCLFEWAGSLLLMVGLAVLWGAPQKFLLGYFTLMCAALVFAGWPLRDHAREPRARFWLVGALIVLALLVGSLVFLTVGQYWVWAVFLAISVLFIAHRYQAMVGAPPAFPASRLA